MKVKTVDVFYLNLSPVLTQLLANCQMISFGTNQNTAFIVLMIVNSINSLAILMNFKEQKTWENNSDQSLICHVCQHYNYHRFLLCKNSLYKSLILGAKLIILFSIAYSEEKW